MPAVRPKRESGVSQAAQVAHSLPINWPAEAGVLQDRLFKLRVAYLAVCARFSGAHATDKSDGAKKCCRNHIIPRNCWCGSLQLAETRVANECERFVLRCGKPVLPPDGPKQVQRMPVRELAAAT